MEFLTFRRTVVCAAAVTLALTLSVPALGHRVSPFGGAWPHATGQNVYLPYATITQGQPAGYYTVINSAMRAWYDAPTRVWPYPTDYNHSVVDFYIVNTADTYWGITDVHPCSASGCAYRWANIILNRRTVDAESLHQGQAIVVHEVGHALGLSHVCGQAACPAGSLATIMQWGELPYNTPQNHDINDVNAIYP